MVAGSVLSGRYEIRELIGEGGMATVYKAYDRTLARIVAVKVLRDQFASNELSMERFRQEAMSAARLSHPNIVSVYDVGTDGNLSYIVMEYIEGRNLDREIRKHAGPMPVLPAIRIINQVLDGLWHAHTHGLVHRDIKPHNIMISNDGRIKITDFGIARAASEASLTQTGMVVGTVNYTSPEQAKGEPATNKSDLYSTGVMLYEMLTGKLPFQGEGDVAVAIKHISERPIPVRKLNPVVSPMLERVVFKAMEKDPEKRYQGAEAFKAGLMVAEEGYLKGNCADDESIAGSSSQTKTFSRVEGGSPSMPDGKKPAYDQKKGLKRLIILIAVFILIVAASGTAVYRIWRNWIEVDEVAVPDVIGLSLSDAKAKLEEVSLVGEVADSVYDKQAPLDSVLKQDPEPGVKRKLNSEVKLTVSKGQDLCEVPDLTGKDLREAGIMAEAVGLMVGENVLEYSMELENGLIIRQDPAIGEKMMRGSAIKVFVSQGQPPTVVVPNVLGMSSEEAEVALKAAGLKVGFVVETPSDNKDKGKVIVQTPPAGYEAENGSSVDLKVAMGEAVTAGPQSKKFEITYSVPADSWIQEIIINVIDTYGTRAVFGPKSLKSGETVVEIVEVFGSGRIEVWVDGSLYKAYDV